LQKLTLSPGVLLVLIEVATASGQRHLGPVALAAELASSFVIVGLFVATVMFAARRRGTKFSHCGLWRYWTI